MKSAQLDIHFPSKENKVVNFDETVPIDEDFPEREADFLSKQESFNKHLFRPNTYLHKWWARRSGTTFRYILKQLVPSSHLRDFYSSGGLEGAVILDPMMGGGTTIHEAIRLGANVIGYDIDPIPVLQAKASLEDIDPSDKINVFNDFIKKIRESIGWFFLTKCPYCNCESEIQFTLYGLRKKHNNKEVVVVDSFLIRENTNGENISLSHYYPEKKVKYRKRYREIFDKEQARRLKINGKNNDIIDDSISERYVPLIILGQCKEHGSFYKSLDQEDVAIINRAIQTLKSMKATNDNLFRIRPGPKSKDLIARNIKYYNQLFTARQLLFLSTAKQLMKEVPPEHRIWLTMLISTSLEFNSILCGYKGAEKRRAGAIRHVFSHHAYSFPFTSLENNPVFSNNTSGTLGRLFNSRILTASQWAHAPIERRYKDGKWLKVALLNETDIGKECHVPTDFKDNQKMFVVKQTDASRLSLPDQSIDFVVTDPPYYDSVQYADLSHFFRCWLKWFLPEEANWGYMTDKSAVANSIQNNSRYCETLSNIWSECNRVLIRPHGRLIFTFHHWNPNAWTQLTISLKRACFKLINYYVVSSENPISVHIRNLNAIKHDSILIFKPDDIFNNKTWDEIEFVEVSDSRSFCKDCSKLLGWILDNEFSEIDIKEIWHTKLKV